IGPESVYGGSDRDCGANALHHGDGTLNLRGRAGAMDVVECGERNSPMRLISFVVVLLVIGSPLMSFAQSPPPAPADVKAPPADAKKTSTGLAYKVITPGKGTRHPMAMSSVTVHYSGWTTD